METTVFNPTQLYLLQLFSYSKTEETKQELQTDMVNLNFLKQKKTHRNGLIKKVIRL